MSPRLAWLRTMALLILVAGCEESTTAPVVPSSARVDPTMVIVESPTGGRIQTTTNTSMTGQVDGLDVTVDRGRLSIDGKSYGELNPGDHAKVDASGAVEVNGQPREVAR